MKYMNTAKKYGRKVAGYATATGVILGGTMLKAFAEVDTAVSGEITSGKSDLKALGALVLTAVVALSVLGWMKRAAR